MILEVRISTLQKWFTLFGMLFFCGFIRFLFRDSSDGGVADSLQSDLSGNPINKLFGTLIFLICTFLFVRYKKVVSYSFYRDNLFLILFCLYIFFSFLWSVDPGVTIRRSIFLIAVVSFTLYLSSIYTADVILKTIAYTIAFCALVGLIKAIISPDTSFVTGGLREGAFLGIYVEKNAGARAYALAMTILAASAFSKDRKAIYAIVVLSAAILMARSASGVLLTLFGVGTVLFLGKFSSKSRKVQPAKYWFGFAIYVLGCFLVYQLFELILALVGRDADLTNRTIIWELIYPSMIEKITTGWGYGAYWGSAGADAFVERWSYIGNAHNGYIEILLHGGIPLLIAYILMLISCLSKILTLASQSQVTAATWNSGVAILLQLSIVNFVAYSLPNHVSIDFFVFCAVICCANANFEKKQFDEC